MMTPDPQSQAFDATLEATAPELEALAALAVEAAHDDLADETRDDTW